MAAEAALSPLPGAALSPLPEQQGEASKCSLVLQPHPEHDHGRIGAVAGEVGVEPVAAQRALDPEVAVQLVDQVAGERVDLVAAHVALVVERTPGEFADSGEPATEIVIDFDGVDMRQYAGATRQRGLVDRGGGVESRGG